jgi:hypothetical protein
MGLGGEMEDGIVAFQDSPHQGRVPDSAVDEGMARMVADLA